MTKGPYFNSTGSLSENLKHFGGNVLTYWLHKIYTGSICRCSFGHTRIARTDTPRSLNKGWRESGLARDTEPTEPPIWLHLQSSSHRTDLTWKCDEHNIIQMQSQGRNSRSRSALNKNYYEVREKKFTSLIVANTRIVNFRGRFKLSFSRVCFFFTLRVRT